VKISSILIMALAAGALGAQDAPKLDQRIQVFAELTRPSQITVATNPTLNDQPSRQTGVGIRFQGEIASAPNWYYELGGMFDASSNFSLSNANLDISNVKVTYSYWMLGAGYMGKVGSAGTLGAHLEARGEALNAEGTAVVNGTSYSLNQSNTYLRPWVRGSYDVTFNHVGASTHPFIGLEGSFALLRTTQTNTPDFSNFDDRTLRSLAPRASAALYAGIRF
jgi:hypothetical protein